MGLMMSYMYIACICTSFAMLHILRLDLRLSLGGQPATTSSKNLRVPKEPKALTGQLLLTVKPQTDSHSNTSWCLNCQSTTPNAREIYKHQSNQSNHQPE